MRSKLRDLKKVLLQDPETRAEYDARASEYELAGTLIAARKTAGLTQQQVAERMGTKQAAVARMESGAQKPSFKSIERYAKATGHKAHITLTPAGHDNA